MGPQNGKGPSGSDTGEPACSRPIAEVVSLIPAGKPEMCRVTVFGKDPNNLFGSHWHEPIRAWGVAADGGVHALVACEGGHLHRLTDVYPLGRGSTGDEECYPLVDYSEQDCADGADALEAERQELRRSLLDEVDR